MLIHGTEIKDATISAAKLDFVAGGAFQSDANGNIIRSADTATWNPAASDNMFLGVDPTYTNQFHGTNNTITGFTPYQYTAYTGVSSGNIFMAAQGIFSHYLGLQGSNTLNKNILIGQGDFYTRAGSTAAISSNIVIGDALLEVQASSNRSVSSNAVIGKGKIYGSSAATTAVLGNVILGSSNVPDKIYDSNNSTLVGCYASNISGNSRSIVAIGTRGLTVSGVDNESTPTVYLPRLAIGRGTGGALPTSGGVYALMYDPATGHVSAETAGGGGVWQQIGTYQNVTLKTASPPTVTSYYSFTHNILNANSGSGITVTAGTQGILYNFLNGRYITIEGTSYYGSTITSNILNGDNITMTNNTLNETKRNIINGFQHDWTTSAFANFGGLKDSLISGRDIDGTTTGYGNYMAYLGLIASSNLDITANASTIKNVFAGATQNINFTAAGAINNAAVIGVRYSTPTGLALENDTVIMPKLKIGRGTSGALPTTGGVYALMYDPSTGAVSAESGGGGGSSWSDISTDNVQLGNTSTLTGTSVGKGNVAISHQQGGSTGHTLSGPSIAGDFSANFVNGRTNTLTITGSNSYTVYNIINGRNHNITGNAYNQNIIDNLITGRITATLSTSAYGEISRSLINANGETFTISGGKFRANAVIGNRSSSWNLASYGYVDNVLSAANYNVNSVLTASQDLGYSAIIGCRNMSNLTQAGDVVHSIILGVDGNLAGFAHVSNTVQMPQLRLGRGYNGALPTSGGTKTLMYDPTTGAVSSEDAAAGGSPWQEIAVTSLASAKNISIGSTVTAANANDLPGDANVVIAGSKTNTWGMQFDMPTVAYMHANLFVCAQEGSNRGFDLGQYGEAWGNIINNSIVNMDTIYNRLKNSFISGGTINAPAGYLYITNSANVATNSQLSNSAGSFSDMNFSANIATKNGNIQTNGYCEVNQCLNAGTDNVDIITTYGYNTFANQIVAIGASNSTLTVPGTQTVSNSVLIGTTGFTGAPITNTTLMGLLRLGQGSATLPTSGGTHYLGINSTTGEVVRTATIPSDVRLKNIVGPLDPVDAIGIIRQIEPIRFSWNQDEFEDRDTGEILGFSAQQVKEVRDELVHEVYEKNGEKFYGVKEKQFAAILTAGIKNLDARVAAIENAIENA